MRETWYVLEDGKVADPNEIAPDEGGVLRHKDGVAVAIGPYGPKSTGVDLDEVNASRDEEARKKAEEDAAALKAAEEEAARKAAQAEAAKKAANSPSNREMKAGEAKNYKNR